LAIKLKPEEYAPGWAPVGGTGGVNLLLWD